MATSLPTLEEVEDKLDSLWTPSAANNINKSPTVLSPETPPVTPKAAEGFVTAVTTEAPAPVRPATTTEAVYSVTMFDRTGDKAWLKQGIDIMSTLLGKVEIAEPAVEGGAALKLVLEGRRHITIEEAFIALRELQDRFPDWAKTTDIEPEDIQQLAMAIQQTELVLDEELIEPFIKAFVSRHPDHNDREQCFNITVADCYLMAIQDGGPQMGFVALQRAKKRWQLLYCKVLNQMIEETTTIDVPFSRAVFRRLKASIETELSSKVIESTIKGMFDAYVSWDIALESEDAQDTNTEATADEIKELAAVVKLCSEESVGALAELCSTG